MGQKFGRNTQTDRQTDRTVYRVASQLKILWKFNIVLTLFLMSASFSYHLGSAVLLITLVISIIPDHPTAKYDKGNAEIFVPDLLKKFRWTGG